MLSVSPSAALVHGHVCVCIYILHQTVLVSDLSNCLTCLNLLPLLTCCRRRSVPNTLSFFFFFSEQCYVKSTRKLHVSNRDKPGMYTGTHSFLASQ